MKNKLQSNTLWVSALVFTASMLSLFDVIDLKDVDLSPDSAWVGIAWSVIQAILRLFTKEPVKPITNGKIIPIMLLIGLPFTHLACTGTYPVQEVTHVETSSIIGINGIGGVVNLFYAAAEAYEKISTEQEGAVSTGLSLIPFILDVVGKVDQIKIEAKDLTDDKILTLVRQSEYFSLGKNKVVYEQAVKELLFKIQSINTIKEWLRTENSNSHTINGKIEILQNTIYKQVVVSFGNKLLVVQ